MTTNRFYLKLNEHELYWVWNDNNDNKNQPELLSWIEIIKPSLRYAIVFVCWVQMWMRERDVKKYFVQAGERWE